MHHINGLQICTFQRPVFVPLIYLKPKQNISLFWLLFVDVKNSPCNNSCPNQPPKSERLESPCSPFTGDASCKAFLGCFKLQLWFADNLLHSLFPCTWSDATQFHSPLSDLTPRADQILGALATNKRTTPPPVHFALGYGLCTPENHNSILQHSRVSVYGAFCSWSSAKSQAQGVTHPHGHSASSYQDHISHLQGST